MKNKKNRLADSSSPYLQQHAENPVDWFPWCDEAIQKARTENKPILLSVGYSACHWCHVMAHESFEDPETADLMNRHFINIKVDREERPDIDKIYQTTHLVFNNRSGGWPLTTFLNPHNHAPFFSGTYFPKEPRHQMPSFKKVLHTIHDYFQNHQEEILSQGDAITQTLQKIYAPASGQVVIKEEHEKQAREVLTRAFDKKFGGFGAAPKFPMIDYSRFLIHYWAKSRIQAPDSEGDSQSLYMALHTLKSMLCGGIYDQLGGGLYRYSVDHTWTIPHFEKMLYDNARLLDILADVVVIADDEDIAERIHETADWVMRDMQAPEGGYYAALDADSEGEEGKFYVWGEDEMGDLLDADEYKLLEKHCGLDGDANFEGKWHLRVARLPTQIAKEQNLDLHTVKSQLQRIKQKLLQHRNQRTPPGLDDKILAAWNALMIKGMVKAAIALNEDKYAESARRALSFIQENMYQDGRLKTSHCRGRSQPVSFLDDFAFMLDAVFHLLQHRWDSGLLNFAVELADQLIELFEDAENGGYFFTANDHEKMLQRPRLLHDETLPSGYAVAALALRRLGLLNGNERFIQSADNALAQAAPVTAQDPHSCTTLLHAFDEQRQPPEIVILRGDDEALKPWQSAAARHFSAKRFCFAIPNDTPGLTDAIASKTPQGDTPLAYLCTGTQCLPPLNDIAAFETHLLHNSARLPQTK